MDSALLRKFDCLQVAAAYNGRRRKPTSHLQIYTPCTAACNQNQASQSKSDVSMHITSARGQGRPAWRARVPRSSCQRVPGILAIALHYTCLGRSDHITRASLNSQCAFVHLPSTPSTCKHCNLLPLIKKREKTHITPGSRSNHPTVNLGGGCILSPIDPHCDKPDPEISSRLPKLSDQILCLPGGFVTDQILCLPGGLWLPAWRFCFIRLALQKNVIGIGYPLTEAFRSDYPPYKTPRCKRNGSERLQRCDRPRGTPHEGGSQRLHAPCKTRRVRCRPGVSRCARPGGP